MGIPYIGLQSFDDRRGGVMRSWFTVNNPYVFLGLSSLLVAYLLYMMVRKRKGERPGSAVREPEL